MVENFWKRVKKRMEVPKKKKVAAAGAYLHVFGDFSIKGIPVGLPIKFAKAYIDELETMAHEDKTDEILKILKEINSEKIYKKLRIKIKDEALNEVNRQLKPYLAEINSKLDILLEDHKRFKKGQTELLIEMRKTQAMITEFRAELQDGLLRNPSIMKQISTYGMSPPKPYESFLSHSSKILISATSLANQGKYKEALEELTKLEEERKEEIKKTVVKNKVFIWISARIDFQTGLIKQAESRFGESIGFFDNALTEAFEIDDYEIVALAYYELGHSYYMLKDLHKSHENIKNALEYVESHYAEMLPQTHTNLGVILFELGKNDKAEIEFRESIKIKPDFPDAHFNLGFFLEKNGRREEAEKEYRGAIRFKSDHAKAHTNLGGLLARSGKREEAEKELREAIKVEPHDSVAHNNLGFLLYELGRMGEAEREFKEAIRIKPDYIRAYKNLGILYVDWGKNKEAIEMFEKILEYRCDLSEKEEELILAVLSELLTKKEK